MTSIVQLEPWLVPDLPSSSSCTLQQLTLTDRLQLHPAADFCSTIIYEQPLLGLTQHTKATSTYPRLTKVLHDRISDHPASATSKWIFGPVTGQSHTPIQITSSSLNGPIFIVINSPNKSWPFELILLSLPFLPSWSSIILFSKVGRIDVFIGPATISSKILPLWASNF